MTEYNRPLTRRGLERSRLILSKAIEIFAEKGYDATTLSDITDIAGGSRSLIYHCFGNKEGLFRASLQMMVDEIYGAYEKEGRTGKTLYDELVHFGKLLVSHLVTPRAIGMMRLVYAEVPRCEGLGDWYWREGVLKSYEAFAGVLEHYVVTDRENLLELSRLYIDYLRSGLPTRLLILPDDRPTKKDIEEEVSLVAERFALYVESRFALKTALDD